MNGSPFAMTALGFLLIAMWFFGDSYNEPGEVIMGFLCLLVSVAFTILANIYM